MTNDNNLSVSRIEERKSLQLPRREASGVRPRGFTGVHYVSHALVINPSAVLLRLFADST